MKERNNRLLQTVRASNTDTIIRWAAGFVYRGNYGVLKNSFGGKCVYGPICVAPDSDRGECHRAPQVATHGPNAGDMLTKYAAEPISEEDAALLRFIGLLPLQGIYTFFLQEICCQKRLY